VGASVRSQMEYPGSFLMLAFGHLVITAVEFAGIALLFTRFGSLKGWSLAEVAVLYGMVNVSFAIAEAASAGFDRFGDLLKSGEFDRILLRPRAAELQVAGYELTLRRVGRLAQGLALLAWGLARAPRGVGPGGLALVAAGVASGVCLFYGLLVFQAALAFLTTETLEAMNILTYGGVEMAQYPLEIYHPGLRRFFTWVVPLAAANYLPAVAALGRVDPAGSGLLFQCVSPLLGLAFLGAGLVAFRLGTRRYESTGS
jgi:ABC-2 type transport system permease protein